MLLVLIVNTKISLLLDWLHSSIIYYIRNLLIVIHFCIRLTFALDIAYVLWFNSFSFYFISMIIAILIVFLNIAYLIYSIIIRKKYVLLIVIVSLFISLLIKLMWRIHQIYWSVLWCLKLSILPHWIAHYALFWA